MVKIKRMEKIKKNYNIETDEISVFLFNKKRF